MYNTYMCNSVMMCKRYYASIVHRMALYNNISYL